MTLSWTCALLLLAPSAPGGHTDPQPITRGAHENAPSPQPIVREPRTHAAEILSDALSRLHGVDSTGVTIDGFFRATRLDATGGSAVADSALGTNIDHARLRLGGELHDLTWRIGFDALDSGLSLQDAWITHPNAFSDDLDISLTLGRFRPPFLSSALLDANRLLFPTRTRNGLFYSVRSPGMRAEGAHGAMGWSAAIQDGVLDPAAALGTVRLTYDFTGRGALPWEGALCPDFQSRFWAAASISLEDSLGSGLARALELHYVGGRYSLSCEWLGYGNDYDGDEGVGPWSPDPPNFIWGERRGSTHPLSITATYMFVPDLVELAMRWEDFDDVRGAGFTNTGDPDDVDYDRHNLYIGLNYYVSNHDMKFHLGQLHESRDGFDDSDDITWWGLGMSLSF